jgi:hypothetical protein
MLPPPGVASTLNAAGIVIVPYIWVGQLFQPSVSAWTCIALHTGFSPSATSASVVSGTSSPSGHVPGTPDTCGEEAG